MVYVSSLNETLRFSYNKVMDTAETLQMLQNLGCEYALYAHRQGEEPVLHANSERFSSASLIKVPLLLAWVQLERAGEVSRDEMCCLDDEPAVYGAGFSWLLGARQIPFRDVLLMMIAISDNQCTNLVIRRIGLERVGRVFREGLGLASTALERKLMDYEARARGLDNWVGVQDCIALYELIRGLVPEERHWVESMLRVCQDDALLMRDLPRDGVAFYHKTGSIPHVLHDWGYTHECEMFLLTQKVEDETQLYPIFGKLGRQLLP